MGKQSNWQILFFTHHGCCRGSPNGCGQHQTKTRSNETFCSRQRERKSDRHLSPVRTSLRTSDRIPVPLTCTGRLRELTLDPELFPARGADLLPRAQLEPSRRRATPARAGNVSPWQPADGEWPGDLSCGSLNQQPQTSSSRKQRAR